MNFDIATDSGIHGLGLALGISVGIALACIGNGRTIRNWIGTRNPCSRDNTTPCIALLLLSVVLAELGFYSIKLYSLCGVFFFFFFFFSFFRECS